MLDGAGCWCPKSKSSPGTPSPSHVEEFALTINNTFMTDYGRFCWVLHSGDLNPGNMDWSSVESRMRTWFHKICFCYKSFISQSFTMQRSSLFLPKTAHVYIINANYEINTTTITDPVQTIGCSFKCCCSSKRLCRNIKNMCKLCCLYFCSLPILLSKVYLPWLRLQKVTLKGPDNQCISFNH